MTRKQPRKDFLFIDEAGDPGHEEGCSDVYVSFCLHVSDQTYHDAAEVVMQFRYWRNITKEIKGANYNPEKQAAQRFYRALARLSEQFAVNCTAVFLRKADFTAALSPADSWEGADALWFRNWVMRQLLETHFRFNRAFSNTLEIVFDRYDLSREEQANLEKYISDNYELPGVAYFTHADSRYVDFLQVTDLLQDPFLSIARGQGSEGLRKALSFVSAWDYTDRDNPKQMAAG